MNENWLHLDETVVIITGGASGIGKAVAKMLADLQAVPIIVDLNVDTGTEIEGIYCVKCDVSDRQSVQTMVDIVVEKYGRIDVLINNAGITIPGLLVDVKGVNPECEMTEQTLERMLRVNVKGQFLCAQACAKQMLKQGKGVILNMSSECGKEGSNGQSAYAATKGAIDSFTRSWAKELGKYNIRVLACAPGIVEATGIRTAKYNELLAYIRNCGENEVGKGYEKVIPLGRSGTLSEISQFIVFLISERASYISGTTLNISGGKSRG